MKKPKILGLLFVFLFANFFLIFNPAPVKAQSETQFREWSIMTFFIQCIDEQKETGKSVNGIDDLIKDSSKETIVVGLGFDRNDGAWSCETVIDKGMKILDNSLADKPESAAFNAFCEEIVGESCVNGDTGMSGSKKNENFDSLRSRIIDKRSEVNRAGKGSDRQYVQPLLTNPSGNLSFLSFCYKLQTSEPASDFDAGSEDFIVNLSDGTKVWATLKRENDSAGDIKSVYDLQSKGSRGAVGEKRLGFDYGGSGAVASNWNISSSDFYPLGRHYGKLAEGYTHNAVVDCEWIARNEGLVFGQIKSVSDDGSYTTNWGETASTTEEAGGVEADTCASQSGSEFGWLICPVIEAAQEFMSWLIVDGPMANILRFEVVGEGEDSLEAVWSGFRAIANILFVIVFFVVIYSAATGNVMSSYDVRKLLPRLFIVAILVQLSFFFSMFALNVANIVGDGVRDLMLFPVQGGQAVTVGGLVGQNSEGYDGIISLNASDGVEFVAGGAAGIVVLIALLVVLFYSITGIIILAAVFIVRDMGIVALIVISPIAMAMNVLPGTDKYFKSWWKWYFGLLVMYPAMVAFLTSGQLMASIWNGFSDGGLMDTIITTAILFLPFFFAPRVLKFAGAAAGTLNGVFKSVDDGRNKYLGKDGKVRGSDTYKRNKTKAAGGRAFAEGSRFGKYNRSIQRATGGLGQFTSRGKFMAENRARQIENEEKKIEADGLSKTLTDLANTPPSEKGRLAGHKNKLEEAGGEKVYLRNIANDNTASIGKRMAAINRMITNNDYSGLHREVMQQMEDNGQGALLDRIKEEHGGTLIQKAPHLVKTGPGQAANGVAAAGALGDEDIVKVHGDGLKDMIKTTAEEGLKYKSDSTNTSLSSAERADAQRKYVEAQEALGNVVKQYNSAVANSNISVKPGTVDAMNEFGSLTAGISPIIKP